MIFVEEIKALDCGIQIRNNNVSVMLFADDIAILSSNEKDLQKMLDTINLWCKTWRLTINPDKSNVIHFRFNGKLQSNYEFKCSDCNIEYASQYKYCGMLMNENLDHNFNVKNKTKKYNVFTKLYNTSVVPVYIYGTSTWGNIVQ